jgi:hypothetical protein
MLMDKSVGNVSENYHMENLEETGGCYENALRKSGLIFPNVLLQNIALSLKLRAL